jgi:hypothetical protein
MGEELENELARRVSELRREEWRPGELLDVLASVVDLVEWERDRPRGGWAHLDSELDALRIRRTPEDYPMDRIHLTSPGGPVLGWVPLPRVLDALDVAVLEEDAAAAREAFLEELEGEWRPDHPEEVTE